MEVLTGGIFKSEFLIGLKFENNYRAEKLKILSRSLFN